MAVKKILHGSKHYRENRKFVSVLFVAITSNNELGNFTLRKQNLLRRAIKANKYFSQTINDNVASCCLDSGNNGNK